MCSEILHYMSGDGTFIHSVDSVYICAHIMYYCVVNSDMHLAHSELNNVKRLSGGKNWDKELWYTASEGPIGGLWWQNPVCLLIYALSCGSLFLTLCASRGWKAHSGASLRFELRRTVRSPHEYLIRVAAITHFTSPLCPLPDFAVVCLCVLTHVCVCVRVAV